MLCSGSAAVCAAAAAAWNLAWFSIGTACTGAASVALVVPSVGVGQSFSNFFLKFAGGAEKCEISSKFALHLKEICAYGLRL